MNAASHFSGPLHFKPDRLWGPQVVAQRAADLELMTGLCSLLGLLPG